MNTLLQGGDIKVANDWNKKGPPFSWSDNARNIPLEKYYNNTAFGNPYGVYKGGFCQERDTMNSLMLGMYHLSI